MNQPDTGSYDPTSWLDDCMAMGLNDDEKDENREPYDPDEVVTEPENN